jgi:hypothetical protein
METTTPLSFEINEEMSASLEKLRKQSGGVSFSRLIEHAIAKFDYQKAKVHSGGNRRQLSVRLPGPQRAELEKVAKRQKVSIANLIRMALDDLLESASKPETVPELKALAAQPSRRSGPRKAATDTSKEKPMKKKQASKKTAKAPAAKKAKKVAQKAAKKAAKAIKAVKSVVKKVVPKKAAKKAAAKKAPAKKAPAKKAAAKKAPAKKAAAKKAAAKKAPAKKAAAKKAPAKKAAAKKAAKKS